jgi:hypothetical protein
MMQCRPYRFLVGIAAENPVVTDTVSSFESCERSTILAPKE